MDFAFNGYLMNFVFNTYLMDSAFNGFCVYRIFDIKNKTLKLVSVFCYFRDYLKIIFKMKRVLNSEIICR